MKKFICALNLPHFPALTFHSVISVPPSILQFFLPSVYSSPISSPPSFSTSALTLLIWLAALLCTGKRIVGCVCVFNAWLYPNDLPTPLDKTFKITSLIKFICVSQRLFVFHSFHNNANTIEHKVLISQLLLGNLITNQVFVL